MLSIPQFILFRSINTNKIKIENRKKTENRFENKKYKK